MKTVNAKRQAVEVEVQAKGLELVRNQVSKSKYDWQLVKDEQVVAKGLKNLDEVLKELDKFAVGQQQSAENAVLVSDQEEQFSKRAELEAITLEETAPDVSELSIAEVEPPSAEEAVAILQEQPSIVTSHLKPQFQPARIDLKKTTSQELKQEVLTLLKVQNASQAAKWAKQQGLEVDLCYKSHWAIVLEKAQDLVAVAA